jgi:hypothetical protein
LDKKIEKKEIPDLREEEEQEKEQPQHWSVRVSFDQQGGIGRTRE